MSPLASLNQPLLHLHAQPIPPTNTTYSTCITPMAPSSQVHSFSVVATNAIYQSKHQLTLPEEVTEDLGFVKGETGRVGVSVNHKQGYWVSFRWQKKAWRSVGSGWENLFSNPKIRVGDKLMFNWYEDQFVLQSERLDKHHFKDEGFCYEECEELYCPLNSSGEEDYTSTSESDEDEDDEDGEDDEDDEEGKDEDDEGSVSSGSDNKGKAQV